MASLDFKIPTLSLMGQLRSDDFDNWPPVIVVTGPTACGKSSLALAVAETFDGTIINADSMQMYRDLALLTAKPSATDMAYLPHRLYSILNATEKCSAARWLTFVRSEIDHAYTNGRLPIVVGGTGLYIEALLRGLSPVPEIPPMIQAEARALMAAIGPAAFHRHLTRRDPFMAQRLHPSDTQRLQRAWEVITATGYSLLYWWNKEKIYTRASFCILLFMPTRKKLQASCDRRFWHIVKSGGVSEVVNLLEKKLPQNCPILKALGVAALTDYIRGHSTLKQAILAGQSLTRRYAKRQCTWFRHHLTDAWIVPDLYSAVHSSNLEIFSFIRHFLSVRQH